MIQPQATVIIPTFNHGKTILLAVKTALAQTIPVEIFIIGDGVSEQNRAMIIDLVRDNSNQIRFFDHPKHESRGEPYRHTALMEARGRIVCYLCDRDLWLPDHVERLSALLQTADFAHSLSLHVVQDYEFNFFDVDLALPEWRNYLLTFSNKIAFSCAAHTLEFYQKLGKGWETTPTGKQTDWHMFQQFIERPDCRCISGTYPSAITFPSKPYRINWTEEKRITELKFWMDQMNTPEKRSLLVIAILEANAKHFHSVLIKGSKKEIHQQELLSRILNSPWWKLGEKITGIGLRLLKRFGY